MDMKPYGRNKTRNHSRPSAQYTHPQGPPYYTPMDYTAAATSASAIYTTAPYPPPPAAAYYPPPPQPPYFGYPADKRTVEGMVRKQIEYYLSEENLIKDVFLRNKMDKDGFVLLSEIASFQRVVSLTQDMDTVVSALKESETIEICDGIKIRPKKDPLRWPFPTNVLQYPPQPQAPLIVQQQQPPLIQPRTEHHATRSQTQPQPLHQQVISTTNTPLVNQQEPDVPAQQLQSQQQQNQQHLQHNQKHQQQQQQGQTQLDASSPNNSNSSDISSGMNNIDNINRSSLTYATAVTNKPTVASIVAGTATAAAPAGSSGSNSSSKSSSSSSSTSNNIVNNNIVNNNIINNNNNSNVNANSNTSNHLHHHNTNNNAPTNGPTVASVVSGTAAISSIGDIPNSKHNKSSTPVESEWKEVKSRRRRPGKA